MRKQNSGAVSSASSTANSAAYESARPVLQHRTGMSVSAEQPTTDMLAHLPRWKRWGLCAIATMTLTGVLPMLACAALFAVCDVVGWWLPLAALGAMAAYGLKVVMSL